MSEIAQVPTVTQPNEVAIGQWAKSPFADWPEDLVEVTADNLAYYQSDAIWFLGCPGPGDWCPEGYEFYASYEDAVKALDDE